MAITEFPINTKTFGELDVITDAQATDSDGLMVFDQSVGVMKRMTLGERLKGSIKSIDSIAGFPDLDESTFSARQQFQLGSFAPGGQSGGGLMVWEPDIPKLEHNGINYFSPTVPIPADFDNPTDVQNYKDGVGEEWPANNGVFVIPQIFNETVDTVADLATLSLPIGSKVSTKGCLAIGDGGQGDFIVEAASGSPDGYSRILLDNGNHAVLQQVFNVKQFGASGDGVTDDRDGMQRYFLFCVARELEVNIPDGDYLLDSYDSELGYNAAIFVQSDAGVRVKCSDNAKLIGGTGLSAIAGGAMVRIDREDRELGLSVTWRGGIFDLSQLPSTTTGVDGLNIGPKYQHVVIDRVIFDHGVTEAVGAGIGVGGGDSGLYCKEPEHISITNCAFLGSPDIGTYLTGDNDTERVGRNAVFSNNLFYRCQVGLAAKRYFEKTTITGNHFLECGDGVLLGTADSIPDNQGRRLIVSNNYINKCLGTPIRAINSDFITITGNQILDYRRWVSDGTTETTVALGNLGGAVKMEGVANYTITGNIFGFDEWAPVSTASKQTFGVVYGTFATSGLGCSNGVTTGNTLVNCYAPYSLSDESEGNLFGVNSYEGMLASSTLGTGSNETPLELRVDSGTGIKANGTRTLSMIYNNLELSRFVGVSSAVNYIEISNSATGVGPEVRARGSDTHIDLSLTPRGSNGRVRFGTRTANADAAITGYIEIKDSSGTLRKLAVID